LSRLGIHIVPTQKTDAIVNGGAANGSHDGQCNRWGILITGRRFRYRRDRVDYAEDAQ